MNYYKVKVQIVDSNGQKQEFEIQRNFVLNKDAYIYASGFAQGCVSAFNGVLLDKQIERLNDDRI
jgi:hypothetical protein